MTVEQLGKMAWERFKEGVYDKYIPKSYKKKEEVEFFHLKQGRMSVTEYDRAFSDMSQDAHVQVYTDAKMAEKFCAGLRHEIRITLASHGGLSYPESLSLALDIEAAMPVERSTPTVTTAPHPNQSSGQRKKRNWKGNRNLPDQKRTWQPSTRPHMNARPISAVPVEKRQRRTSERPTYKKQHEGVCKMGTSGCYHCGRGGHFARECPSRSGGTGSRTPPSNPRQLRAMEVQPQELPPMLPSM